MTAVGESHSVRADGGEEVPEDTDGGEEYAEEAVDPYEGFASGETRPEPNDPREGDAEGAYNEYVLPGYDGDPEPPFGHDPLTGRPLGPPCRNCDEPMTVESWGWASTTGETVDWAVCEGCGLGWGPVTEWVDLNADDEAERDPNGGRDQPPNPGDGQ